MAITGKFITSTTGTYSYEKKDISVEWIVFSDDMKDFTANISLQGIASGDNLITEDNSAAGWLPPGYPYKMGNDSVPACIAESVEITERKIISGTGNSELKVVSGGSVSFVPISPSGIVQYKASQKFSTKNPENKSGNSGGSQQPPPAASDKWSISSDVEYKEVPFERDVETNKLITNSAGQKFIPPVTYRKAVTVYSLSRTEFVNPVAKSRIYRNVVNSDTWHGAAPETVLMDSISPSKEKDGLWQVSYKFKYDPDGWQIYVLDTGTMQKNASGKLSAILDKDQAAVQEPVKLNGSGQPLEDQSAAGVDLGPFRAYKKMSFAGLNIPDFSTI